MPTRHGVQPGDAFKTHNPWYMHPHVLNFLWRAACETVQNEVAARSKPFDYEKEVLFMHLRMNMVSRDCRVRTQVLETTDLREEITNTIVIEPQPGAWRVCLVFYEETPEQFVQDQPGKPTIYTVFHLPNDPLFPLIDMVYQGSEPKTPDEMRRDLSGSLGELKDMPALSLHALYRLENTVSGVNWKTEAAVVYAVDHTDVAVVGRVLFTNYAEWWAKWFKIPVPKPIQEIIDQPPEGFAVVIAVYRSLTGDVILCYRFVPVTAPKAPSGQVILC